MRISIEVPDGVAHLVQVHKEQSTSESATLVSRQLWKPLAITALVLLGLSLVLSAVSKIYRQQHTRQYHERMEQLIKSTEGSHAHLAYYLLSGASFEFNLMVEDQDKAEKTVQQLLVLSQTPDSRQALESLVTLQHRFKEFAYAVSEKRKQVDAGNSTVAELQIFFLNQDPDQISADIDKALTRVLETQTEY